MNVMNLGRREAVKLKARILRTERAQKIFIPLDSKIRMQTALHQNACAAERDRLVDLFANLFKRAHVSVGCAGPAVERAERADDVANVRVVNVSIDDVGDDVVRVLALANLVSRRAYLRDFERFE